MAGMPASLIERANELLVHLESKHLNEEIGESVKKIATDTGRMQLSIFDAHTETFEDIRKLLDGIDINRLTPVEALLKLQEIKNLLRS
jgi:DNA mismatch repair protein MutS